MIIGGRGRRRAPPPGKQKLWIRMETFKMRTATVYAHKGISKVGELAGRLALAAWLPPAPADVIRDVPYAGESGSQRLDIYLPRGAPPFPVMVYIHGGGFHFLDKRTFGRLCRYFASKGYVVFNVNYRMAPRHRFPVGLQDVARAVRWVHERARLYWGDPAGMVLAGESAGAYFASMYAAASLSSGLASALSIEETVPPEHLKGLVLYYGAYDMETVLDTGFGGIEMMAKGFFGHDPQVFAARAALASPLKHVTEEFPPAFLASGERDRLHSQSLAFERVLTEKGVPHESVFFTTAEYPHAYSGHGFVSAPFLKCSRIARSRTCEFLEGLR